MSPTLGYRVQALKLKTKSSHFTLKGSHVPLPLATAREPIVMHLWALPCRKRM